MVALGAAVLLASMLAYVSFSASTEARTPAQLLHAGGARSYQLTGIVVRGSVRHRGAALEFRVRGRASAVSVPVRYAGAVPEPFREGREVIVTVRRRGPVFIGARDSLVTKCPSKFTARRTS